jgi:hypothetical protein
MDRLFAGQFENSSLKNARWDNGVTMPDRSKTRPRDPDQLAPAGRSQETFVALNGTPGAVLTF